MATSKILAGDAVCTANLMVYDGLLSTIEFTLKPTGLSIDAIRGAEVVVRPEEYLDITRLIHREEHEDT